MDSEIQEYKKQIIELAQKYKELENNRTIQIFHVIALINGGILSQLKTTHQAVYGFCYSLIALAFAYFYWVFAEHENFRLMGIFLAPQNENKSRRARKPETYYNKFTFPCFISAVISAICLIISILLLFAPPLNLTDIHVSNNVLLGVAIFFIGLLFSVGVINAKRIAGS